MSKIDDIKAAVAQLSQEELATLHAWLDELAEQRFDDQIQRDEKSGKLDRLSARALGNLASGRVRDL